MCWKWFHTIPSVRCFVHDNAALPRSEFGAAGVVKWIETRSSGIPLWAVQWGWQSWLLLLQQGPAWLRAGEGWQIVRVGGAMRGEASHDADFVVWHPTRRAAAPAHFVLCFSLCMLCSSLPAH